MVITRKFWYYAIGGLVAGLVLGISWGLFRPQSITAPTVTNAENTNAPANANTSPNPAAAGVTTFSTLDLPDRDPAFEFTAAIPTAWAAEYVPGSQAINVYDPRGERSTSLENSKIFIRYFTATTFQTLTTVDILERTTSTIADRPAVTYVIRKKSAAADFPSQPAWRNGEHRVTDIRSTDDNPTTFYVFAKAPDVSDETFDAFLASLKFTTEL